MIETLIRDALGDADMPVDAEALLDAAVRQGRARRRNQRVGIVAGAAALVGALLVATTVVAQGPTATHVVGPAPTSLPQPTATAAALPPVVAAIPHVTAVAVGYGAHPLVYALTSAGQIGSPAHIVAVDSTSGQVVATSPELKGTTSLVVVGGSVWADEWEERNPDPERTHVTRLDATTLARTGRVALPDAIGWVRLGGWGLPPGAFRPPGSEDVVWAATVKRLFRIDLGAEGVMDSVAISGDLPTDVELSPSGDALWLAQVDEANEVSVSVHDPKTGIEQAGRVHFTVAPNPRLLPLSGAAWLMLASGFSVPAVRLRADDLATTASIDVDEGGAVSTPPNFGGTGSGAVVGDQVATFDGHVLRCYEGDTGDPLRTATIGGGNNDERLLAADTGGHLYFSDGTRLLVTSAPDCR